MSEERSWFWNQGYFDALEGRPWIVPDETRHQWQSSDYDAGYRAGKEDISEEDDESGNALP